MARVSNCNINILYILAAWTLAASEVIVPVGRLIPSVTFYPEKLYGVVEHETQQAVFEVGWEESNDTSSLSEQLTSEYYVSIFSADPSILEMANSSSFVDCVEVGSARKNYTFVVKGVFLGYTSVEVKLTPALVGCEVAYDEMPTNSEAEAESFVFQLVVSVIRQPSVLINSVTGIFAALVAFNYINMGVQLDLECIKDVLRRPIGPIIGFVCQFLFMPLASYGLGLLLLDDDSLRLGLFTLGSSPGGSMSNFWTLLFKGDVNLSITMTFISTLAALAMMPFWIFTLGSKLFRDRNVTIPYTNMAGSLILLTLPIGIGLLIQQYSPRLTRISKKIIKPFTLICIVLGITFGMIVNRFVFYLFTWQMVVAGLGIAWGGYCFGAAVSWMFRLNRAQIVAISVETAIQNPAVAFVLLLLSMPQPDADLSSVPIVAQLMLTGVPLWIMLVVTRVHSRMKKRSQGDSGKGGVKNPEIDTVQKAYFAVDTNPPDENEDVLFDSSVQILRNLESNPVTVSFLQGQKERPSVERSRGGIGFRIAENQRPSGGRRISIDGIDDGLF